MEQITFEDTAREMVSQLETTLSKLALAAECKISTGHLEEKAKKLASKLKSSATLFNGLPLYKDVKGSEVYNWDIAEKLPEGILVVYANLCKKCSDQLDVKIEDDKHYAKITEGIFVCLNDLPPMELPKFKVKLEGNTLIAVRTSMLAMLPKETQKLLGGKDD